MRVWMGEFGSHHLVVVEVRVHKYSRGAGSQEETRKRGRGGKRVREEGVRCLEEGKKKGSGSGGMEGSWLWGPLPQHSSSPIEIIALVTGTSRRSDSVPLLPSIAETNSLPQPFFHNIARSSIPHKKLYKLCNISCFICISLS